MIAINDHCHVTTKTFQKPINIHFYIPPASAHPPGVLKNLIYGNLHRYWNQNTYVGDCMEIAKQFVNCLIAHGYRKENTQETFIKASHKFDNFLEKKKPTKLTTCFI
jgi:hypothetical protein